MGIKRISRENIQKENVMGRKEDKRTTFLVSDEKNVCASPAIPAGQVGQMPHVPGIICINSLLIH